MNAMTESPYEVGYRHGLANWSPESPSDWPTDETYREYKLGWEDGNGEYEMAHELLLWQLT